jgi:transcriptional regulator with XRE-family HTH domain
MTTGVQSHDEGSTVRLGRVIRRLRRERGLTLEELALEAQTSASYVSKVERGSSTPGWIVVRRLAAALDVKVSDIATHEENEP